MNKHRPGKLHALRCRPGDQCGCYHRKHHLVNHESHLRNRGGVIRIRVDSHAAQESMLKIPDKRTASAEGQAIADQRPQHADQRHQCEALHHDGQHVFLAYQAAVEQSQSRPGHHQHQRGADQHPRVVCGRLRGSHFLVQLVKFFGDDFGYFRGGAGRGAQERRREVVGRGAVRRQHQIVSSRQQATPMRFIEFSECDCLRLRSSVHARDSSGDQPRCRRDYTRRTRARRFRNFAGQDSFFG